MDHAPGTPREEGKQHLPSLSPKRDPTPSPWLVGAAPSGFREAHPRARRMSPSHRKVDIGRPLRFGIFLAGRFATVHAQLVGEASFMESDAEEEAAGYEAQTRNASQPQSLTCRASRPSPAPLTTPPARSRRARRRRRQIRSGLRVFTRAGGSGWKAGDLGCAPMEESSALGRRRRRADRTGQGFPRSPSWPPTLTNAGARKQIASPRRRRERGSREEGFRTSRSDEDETSRRGRTPSAARRPHGRARWPVPPANAACRPTTSPRRLGPPPQEPLASGRGWSAEIPAATFTGARAGFPAAVSGSGEGRKGMGGVAAAAEP